VPSPQFRTQEGPGWYHGPFGIYEDSGRKRRFGSATAASAVKPEFVAVSWYKVFGYPTGIGCLLARRDALARLHRPWFSGGTVVSASAQGGWYRLAEDESGFEDGTLNFLSIPDVTAGLAWISGIGIDLIHRRVGYLTGWLLDGLAGLKHGSGAPMVRLYGPGPADGGPAAGRWRSTSWTRTARWSTSARWRGTRARRASRCGPAASATRARANGRSG
jgi:selenocysteine lyase/cysteine desulfurase